MTGNIFSAYFAHAGVKVEISVVTIASDDLDVWIFFFDIFDHVDLED